MKHSFPGLLAAFEGIDGSGKSTQIELCRRKLEGRGIPCVTLFEPSDSPAGRRIRELAKVRRERPDPLAELELFIEDRKDHVAKKILPALREGRVVLLDRYYYSTIAYQGARGLDPGEIRRRNEEFAPEADLILLFDLPAGDGLARVRSSRNEIPDAFERLDYQEKVRERFTALTDPQIVRIDACSSVDEVNSAIMRHILRRYAEKTAKTP